jgi:hypothetical protein
MKQKLNYSKFKKWPSDAKLKGIYSCEESRNHDQDISMNEKTFVEMCGTHMCAIFLVKLDVTIQDRALGSVIGYIPIFSQYSPCMSLHLKTPNAAKRNQF